MKCGLNIHVYGSKVLYSLTLQSLPFIFSNVFIEDWKLLEKYSILHGIYILYHSSLWKLFVYISVDICREREVTGVQISFSVQFLRAPHTAAGPSPSIRWN